MDPDNPDRASGLPNHKAPRQWDLSVSWLLLRVHQPLKRKRRVHRWAGEGAGVAGRREPGVPAIRAMEDAIAGSGVACVVAKAERNDLARRSTSRSAASCCAALFESGAAIPDRMEQRLIGCADSCATGDRARQQQLALGVVVAQVGSAHELLARRA